MKTPRRAHGTTLTIATLRINQASNCDFVLNLLPKLYEDEEKIDTSMAHSSPQSEPVQRTHEAEHTCTIPSLENWRARHYCVQRGERGMTCMRMVGVSGARRGGCKASLRETVRCAVLRCAPSTPLAFGLCAGLHSLSERVTHVFVHGGAENTWARRRDC